MIAPSSDRARADVERRLGAALLAALDLAVSSALAQPAPPAAEPSRPADDDEEVFLHLDQVGHLLGLERTSVEALLKHGGPLYPPVKWGRAVRVPRSRVRALMRRKVAEAGGELPGEESEPIDIGRGRRRNGAASSAARSPRRQRGRHTP